MSSLARKSLPGEQVAIWKLETEFHNSENSTIVNLNVSNFADDPIILNNIECDSIDVAGLINADNADIIDLIQCDRLKANANIRTPYLKMDSSNQLLIGDDNTHNCNIRSLLQVDEISTFNADVNLVASNLSAIDISSSSMAAPSININARNDSGLQQHVIPPLNIPLSGRKGTLALEASGGGPISILAGAFLDVNFDMSDLIRGSPNFDSIYLNPSETAGAHSLILNIQDIVGSIVSVRILNHFGAYNNIIDMSWLII